jgi:hypothetical protein
MKLYAGWELDYEQRGNRGYWYRIGARGNPLVIGSCETCGSPCLLAERGGVVLGRFCSPAHRRNGDVGKIAKHKRLYKIRGKAVACVWGCQHSYYEWANLTGNYDDPLDYAQMCVRCHARFDTAIESMSLDLPTCSVCGVVSTASKYGVCQTTPECRREVSKRNQQRRREINRKEMKP